ncbi:hypothetical protein [Lyngbya confervoides]|uniref:Uncharacterized protein n=1 Tax=Lyngbya confervoides BDU141951 TaxID=1574623 RepID=A0ABD4T6A9_9CYAN|nr:hypothetical protein [Lyngbya confervoides]MCM1984015.1 hypothetical protein [Lyngbya confervoides BDU141951]
MNPFVGVKTVESLKELKDVLEDFYKSDSYWFLKWPHEVSGFIDQSLENLKLSHDGQLIHADHEIRWQRKNSHYSLLLLASDYGKQDFKSLEGNWKIREVSGMVYEPPIPKFATLKPSPIQVRQRYFIDARTETIRFVALIPRNANARK